MKRHLLHSLTMVFALLVCTPSPASAQPSGAVEHFEAAQEHFNAGHFLEAALEYKSAYAAAPDKHVLLYNIGLAYHRAGRISEALESYERYLKLAPDGTAVEEVREYVAEFRSLLGRQDPEPTEEPAETPHHENGSEDIDDPMEHTAHPVASRRLPRAPMGATEKSGWLVGAGGVGLLLAGVGTGLWASSYEDEVERIYNTGNAFPDGKDSRARLLSGLTIGLATAGGAAVLTGAVLIWWGRDAESSPAAGIALSPFSNDLETMGLSACGSF